MYKLTRSNSVIRLSDNICIPLDSDYQEFRDYVSWLSEGNEPEPADIPPVSIPDISMRQARLALLADGLLATVNLAITTAEQEIWWEYSTVVERSNPLVIEVLTALGKTPEEIDTMFIGAAAL